MTCWKFAYLVHKLLRDGHISMVKDSRAYIPRLNELAKYWSHIQGYGPLIESYFKEQWKIKVKLVQNQFHKESMTDRLGRRRLPPL